MRVLIVEDDRELAESLARVLDESGMVAEIATNGREADFWCCTEKYDAAVLDLGLPELDGVSVLQHWREQGAVSGADSHRARSLERQAFGLWCRCRRLPHQALHARGSGAAAAGADASRLWPCRARAAGGAAVVRHASGPFFHGRQRLGFTAQEERILAYLMHQPGVVLSRADISEHVYARDSDPDSNAIDVLISRIRRKLARR